VAELVARLVREHGCEVHLYAQEVEDIEVTQWPQADASERGRVVWHRVARIPGPHLFQFIHWLAVNRIARWRDRWIHGLHCDAVFSPGINALDADVVLVHAVFHRLKLLQDARGGGGLRGLHRSMYYRLLCWLESRVYRRKLLRLAAVSRHTARQLDEYFGRTDVNVIPNGVDTVHFSPANRDALRVEVRERLGYSRGDIVLLLVGNDFRNKGLPVLLEAVKLCGKLQLKVCVVGEDALATELVSSARSQLEGRIRFAGETRDILSFYSAADIYTAPSLEDSFNLPALEAMACGLPVVVSRNAGISEYLRDGENGVLLQDAADPDELAEALSRIASNPGVAEGIGAEAVSTAAELSWDRHAKALLQLIQSAKEDA